MKIKILYNNTARKGFRSKWGFSCLIKNDKKVLFDTGADFKTLKYNADKMNIDFKEIDIVVISHKHFDHIGGLDGFLKENKNKAKVILPDKNKSFEISQNIYSTGALSSDSLGIFSLVNEGKEWADRKFKISGLESFFEKTIVSGELGIKKPRKDFFEKSLDIIQAKPEECLFIDDKKKNCEGAREVGIKSIVFKNMKQMKKEVDEALK